MLRYPRVLIIKRIKYIPTYQELYQVDTMRPNRPMRSKFGLSKSQANSFARQELAVLKSEGYEKAGTSSELCHWLHFFRSMSNADGQTGAVFLLVKSGWARCPA